jgi:hypothetical protein
MTLDKIEVGKTYENNNGTVRREIIKVIGSVPTSIYYREYVNKNGEWHFYGTSLGYIKQFQQWAKREI